MTFDELKIDVAKYLIRTDMDDMIGKFINRSMKKLERKYNFRHMKGITDYLLKANTYWFDNPISNYKELISIASYDGNSVNQIRKQSFDYVSKAFAVSQTGGPQLIAEVGDWYNIPMGMFPEGLRQISGTDPNNIPNLQWIIRPVPDIDYRIRFVAYQYTPDLGSTIFGTTIRTNWWTQLNSDILLYATLLDAHAYVRNIEMIPVWKAFLDDSIKDLIDSERREQFSGSMQFLNADNVY